MSVLSEFLSVLSAFLAWAGLMVTILFAGVVWSIGKRIGNRVADLIEGGLF